MHIVIRKYIRSEYDYDLVRKYIAFFMERSYKFSVNEPIAILFDMSDAGFENLDMNMIIFVVK